jgi:hypothetical protein
MRAERQAIGSPAAGAKSARSERERSSWPFFARAAAPKARQFCPEFFSVMGECSSIPFLKKEEKRRGLRFRSAGRWAMTSHRELVFVARS